MPNGSRLYTRIAIVVSIALVLIGLSMVYSEQIRLRDAYLSERRAHLEKFVQAEEMRLDQVIDTLRRDVVFLSNTPPVSGIERASRNHGVDPRDGNSRAKWEARLQEIFSAFSQAHPVYYQIRYIGVADGGREIVRIDHHGDTVTATPATHLRRVGGRDYFKAAQTLRNGEVHLSEFELSADDGVPTLRASTPVFSPDGHLFGMLVLNLDVRELLAAARERLPDGVETYISNDAGQYLLHPDVRMAFRSGEGRSIVADFPVLTRLFKPHAHGNDTITVGDGKQLFAAARLHFDPREPGRFLLLMYRIPEVMANHSPLLVPASQLLGAVLLMLSLGVLAIVFLRRAFAPLESLTQAAEKIAAGERNIEFPREGYGEIGMLIRAFRSMSNELSKREMECQRINADLEGRVKQRTTDLAFSNELMQSAAERSRVLQQEAEQQSGRIRALMATSMDGIHVMDMQGNVIEVNDAFCRMLGYSREEVSGMNVGDWDRQWSAEELRDRFVSLIGKSELFETVHRRKDGTLIDVEISAAGVELDGRPLLFASSRDITARKQAERMMRQHEMVLSTAIDGYWMTDMQGFLLEANQAYADMSGYALEELIGMHISQLEALEQSPGEVQAHIAKVIAQGYDRFETMHRRKDGSIIDIDVSTNYMAEAGHLFVFCKEITGRKRIERELSQITGALNMAQDGVFMFHPDNLRFIYVNDGAVHQTGYSREELLCMTPLDIKPEFDESRFRNMLKPLITGEVMSKTFTTVHRCKEGEDVPVEIILQNLDGGAEDGRLVAYVRDISQRIKAEESSRIAAVAFETQDAIVITDAEANIIKVNRSFTQITGYSADEVVGKNPRIMGSGRHDRQFYQDMWKRLNETGSWAGEIWDKRKNGQIYPRWMTITAVKNEWQEVTHYVGLFTDITERKQAEEEIRHLAFYDVLTGLPNRRLFIERCQSALIASVRRRSYGALLFLDMDRFKMLNDTLGHDYGDLMLIEVAERLKGCVREMDTVARLGGDEFVVLIEDISLDEQDALHKVATVAEKIRETLACPYRLKEAEHNSSPSIGVALYRGSDQSVDELLKQADIAMYQVKHAGRNAVCFFDPAMQPDTGHQHNLNEEMIPAISRGEFHLYYQLQVDDEQRPVGAEALLRWDHPQRGLLLPDSFIPVAEQSGLILEIDRWVLNEACAQLARWSHDESTQGLTLAVNVSGPQFAQADFVEQVAEMLDLHRIRPERLMLEPTERMVLDDIHEALQKMQALKALGVSLSMDDLGNGYSSLIYLKQLPLDQVKICKSFVQEVALNDSKSMLVQAIIELGNKFGLSVLAEGVENEAQLAFLKQHGCMLYQGLFFGKAMPLDEFESSLRL